MSRVLMTADAVGGVWTFALELARALSRDGIGVTLAVMGPAPTGDQLADAAGIPGIEIEARPFRLEWMPDAWDDMNRAADWLLGLEHRIGPSVVHLNGYAHAASPFQRPVVVTAHSCVCSWNEAVGGFFDCAWYARYRAMVSRGLAEADAVVAPSAAMLSALNRCYGVLAHARVVPNGRDPSRFTPSAKLPLVFAAGRLWDLAKNVESLVRVAAQLPWPTVLAGDETLAAANVRHVGRLSALDIAAWLEQAAIVAAPARYEPFGLLALEAALAGCAIVVGDIPSQREIWGDAATFADPESDESLAAALRELIDRPDHLAEMAVRARQQALRYSPERMATGYRTVYQAVLAQPETARRRVPCAS
jgi:glycogen synthase